MTLRLHSRVVSIVFAMVLACTSAAQAAPKALDFEQARHLLARTGFGASTQELDRFIGLSAEAAVDLLLAETATTPSRAMPDWVSDWKYPVNVIYYLGDTATDLFYTQRSVDLFELTDWWLAEMVQTPTPLTERMVLFWHDHFATSFSASDNAQWMADQNVFFRQNAVGNFAELASGVLRDPAVLQYLSNTENHKDAPNENLAREFLELFTLGEGRGYTELDVKDAARALTGHGTNWAGSPVYRFHPDLHDDGKKIIFGKRGRFDAPDLVDLVLNHPDFGPYIVEKLWLTFVSHAPDPVEVGRLAALWRAENFELQPLLREMFLSDAFWNRRNRATIVKSPVEVFVGTVRTLGLAVEDTDAVRWALEEMGQELFAPPNVAGWSGGTAWINTASILARAESLAHLSQWRAEPVLQPLVSTPDAYEAPALNDGFRVGTVIALEASKQDEGESFATYIHMFDVSYQADTWRSLTAWIEDRTDDPPSISIDVTDCEPACFASWPRAEWDGNLVSFSAEPDWFASYSDQLSPEDRQLMAQIIGLLPMMLEQTETQNIWDPNYHEPEYRDGIAGFDDVDQMLRTFADMSQPILGAPTGELLVAPSRLGLLGLGPDDTYLVSDDDAEKMMEMAMTNRFAAREPIGPALQHATHQAWLDALPGQGMESQKAVLALLPVLPDDARQEMVVGDVDALVRRLLLSPLYQLK